MFCVLYIANKVKCFNFKSGCVVWVVKRLKNTGSWCCSSDCKFVPLLKRFTANVLKCKDHLNVKFKCVFVTIYF